MKARQSKIDQHADSLIEWFNLEKLSLKDAQTRLAAQGVRVSLSRLSTWWSQQQERLMQEQLLASIASGARFNRDVEERFAKAPPPEMEAIKGVLKTLVMQLAVKGQAEPTLLDTATQLLDRVLKIEAGGRKEKELQLRLEQFAAQFCDIVRQAAADATVKAMIERKAANGELIAHLRQTYFSDIDALERTGQVQLPT